MGSFGPGLATPPTPESKGRVPLPHANTHKISTLRCREIAGHILQSLAEDQKAIHPQMPVRQSILQRDDKQAHAHRHHESLCLTATWRNIRSRINGLRLRLSIGLLDFGACCGQWVITARPTLRKHPCARFTCSMYSQAPALNRIQHHQVANALR